MEELFSSVFGLALTAVVAGLVTFLGVWIFERTTRDIDEWAELQKGNLAVGIVLGAIVVGVGGWDPPLGITLVADRLSALILFTAAAALLAVLVYVVSEGNSDKEFAGFHPVYQILAAGVALALLTGDLFTLFVAFEIMLTASYVLLTHRAGGTDTPGVNVTQGDADT